MSITKAILSLLLALLSSAVFAENMERLFERAMEDRQSSASAAQDNKIIAEIPSSQNFAALKRFYGRQLQAALRLGNYVRLLEILNAWYDAVPGSEKDEPRWNLWGFTYYHGNIEDAVKLGVVVVEKASLDSKPLAQVQLATQYIDLYRLDRAEDLLKAAAAGLRHDPNSMCRMKKVEIMLRHQKARLLLLKGLHQRAMEDIDSGLADKGVIGHCEASGYDGDHRRPPL